MEAIKSTMKNNKNTLDISFSNSSSHGHGLSTFNFSFNATPTSSSSNDWLIDSEGYYHMDKDKTIFFYLLMNVPPNKYLLVMTYLLVLWSL